MFPDKLGPRYNRRVSSKVNVRAGALLLVAGGFLVASPLSFPSQQADSFDLEGKISQQSQGRLTVDQGQGILFHVVYDEHTVIVGPAGKPGTGQDFKVGGRVHVLGDFNESGEVKARRIEVQAADTDGSSQSPPKPQEIALPGSRYHSPHPLTLLPLPAFKAWS